MRDWPNMLADPGSIRPIAGADESVAAACVQIEGHDTVLIWCRFDVAAGTLSVAAGERFVQAVDVAIADGVPVVAIANSGGARMQEGSRGFVQMIDATRAVRRLRDAGLCLTVYLADPTTGGVFASWASLGHLTFAEPGAIIGFTGPRVAAALGEPIEPASSQTAEGIFANGLVDDIVTAEALRSRLADVLGMVAPAESDPTGPDLTDPDLTDPDLTETVDGPAGWAAVLASRRIDRTSLLADIVGRSSIVVELRGDRAGGVGSATFAGLCRVDGGAVMVIGHRRPEVRPTVADLRMARRAMEVAEALRVPVVTVIDTAGAAISGEQERQGLAGEIARSIDTLSSLTVPTLAVIAGQGSGGAAMAWLAADRVIATPDSWLAPIAPEAASVIVHRDTGHADEMADQQAVGAIELREQGIVDGIYDAGRIALHLRRLVVSGPR